MLFASSSSPLRHSLNIVSSFSFTIHSFHSILLHWLLVSLFCFSYLFVSSIGKVFFAAITSLFHWSTAVFIGFLVPPFFCLSLLAATIALFRSPFTIVLPSRTSTSVEMPNKCNYFTFTNAAIEPHLISTHS